MGLLPTFEGTRNLVRERNRDRNRAITMIIVKEAKSGEKYREEHEKQGNPTERAL